ncbi:MAG: hypothetical protein ACU0CI_06815 [Shimia sp.]
MKYVLAAIMALSTTPAFAGSASDGAMGVLGVCDGPAFEAKVYARFQERYPSLTGPISAQPPKLVRTASVLVQNECRTAALQACDASTSPEACRGELAALWQGEAATERTDLMEALASVDLETLPALQRARLAQEENWVRPVDCGADGTLCDARTALHTLTSLELRNDEVAALDG